MVLRNWREVRPNQRSVVPSSRMPRRAATAWERALSRSVRASTWPIPASAAAARSAPAASVANPCPWYCGCRCQPTSVRPVGPSASARGMSGTVPAGGGDGVPGDQRDDGPQAERRVEGSFPGVPSVQPLARLVQGRQGTARMRSQPAHDVVPRVEVVEAGRSDSSQCRSSRRGVRSSSIRATCGRDVRGVARTARAGFRACPLPSSPRRRRPAIPAARRAALR